MSLHSVLVADVIVPAICMQLLTLGINRAGRSPRGDPGRAPGDTNTPSLVARRSEGFPGCGARHTEKLAPQRVGRETISL